MKTPLSSQASQNAHPLNRKSIADPAPSGHAQRSRPVGTCCLSASPSYSMLGSRVLKGLRGAEQSGALYAGAAAVSAVAAGAFLMSDRREQQARTALLEQLDARESRLYKTRKDAEDGSNIPHDAATIWSGTIVKAMPGLNGEMMLRGAKVCPAR